MKLITPIPKKLLFHITKSTKRTIIANIKTLMPKFLQSTSTTIPNHPIKQEIIANIYSCVI